MVIWRKVDTIRFSQNPLFTNLDVWNFDLLWSPIVVLSFWPVMTGLYEGRSDHMAGECTYCTILLLSRLLSVHSSSVFYFVKLIAFSLYWMRLSFNHGMHSKVLVFIKNKHSCFFSLGPPHYFVSSWNQIGFLKWQWILMFVAVLSVPINHACCNWTFVYSTGANHCSSYMDRKMICWKIQSHFLTTLKPGE
jgi:hypothetical protein